MPVERIHFVDRQKVDVFLANSVGMTPTFSMAADI